MIPKVCNFVILFWKVLQFAILGIRNLFLPFCLLSLKSDLVLGVLSVRVCLCVMKIEELEEAECDRSDGVSGRQIVRVDDAKRALVGAGARILFYPTLLYNVLRNKIEAEFRWWDEVDQVFLFHFCSLFWRIGFVNPVFVCPESVGKRKLFWCVIDLNLNFFYKKKPISLVMNTGVRAIKLCSVWLLGKLISKQETSFWNWFTFARKFVCEWRTEYI